MVGVLEEQETESHDGGASHVVIHIRHRHVQQLTDRLVVPCTAVRHGDGVHTRPAQVVTSKLKRASRRGRRHVPYWPIFKKSRQFGVFTDIWSMNSGKKKIMNGKQWRKITKLTYLRRMASLSLQSEVMRGSASSSLPYITSAMPTANPVQQKIFTISES